MDPEGSAVVERRFSFSGGSESDHNFHAVWREVNRAVRE
jgi:hypothetical protein